MIVIFVTSVRFTISPFSNVEIEYRRLPPGALGRSGVEREKGASKNVVALFLTTFCFVKRRTVRPAGLAQIIVTAACSNIMMLESMLTALGSGKELFER